MPRPRARRSVVSGVALVLAVALTGCGDDAAQPQASASSPASDTASSGATQRSSPASSRADGPVLTVSITGDEVSPLASTIEMGVGDALVVEVTADRAGELHVHSSPEQYVEFEPGRSRHEVELDKPGQVDVEEHESGALVARVLVS